jgi:hypothetical protein
MTPDIGPVEISARVLAPLVIAVAALLMLENTRVWALFSLAVAGLFIAIHQSIEIIDVERSADSADGGFRQ